MTMPNCMKAILKNALRSKVISRIFDFILLGRIDDNPAVIAKIVSMIANQKPAVNGDANDKSLFGGGLNAYLMAYNEARSMISKKEFTNFDIFIHHNEELAKHITASSMSLPDQCDEDHFSEFFWMSRIHEHYGKISLFDVGANYGQTALLYDLFMKSRGIAADIYSYEPSGRTFDLLEKTIRHNKLDVHAVHCALGEKWEYIILKGVIGNAENNMITDVKTPSDYYEVVECRTLDSELERVGRMDSPIFLKVDVQGAEGLVVAGGVRTFEKLDFAAMVEFSPYLNAGYDHFALLWKYLENFIVLNATNRFIITPDNIKESVACIVEKNLFSYANLILIPKKSPLSGYLDRERQAKSI